MKEPLATGCATKPSTRIRRLPHEPEQTCAARTCIKPGLPGAEVLSLQVGLRPSTPDGEPIVGPVADRPGLGVATGTGPSGLLLGSHCGQHCGCSIAARCLDLEEGLGPRAPFHPA